MRITSPGNVGIGTTNPTAKLQVAGDLRVTGQILYAAAAEALPDYVFEPGYELMPIRQLGSFLEEEKHLPNVPSAAEMKEKGLSLSEFQMKLLEKIEELTLYTVQQAKTIREQQQRLTALEQIIAQQVPQERK